MLAMQRQGGHELACPRMPDEDTVNFTRRYWRFKSFVVRVTAGRNTYTAAHEGNIGISGFTQLPPECSADWLARRERERDRERVCDDAPIKIALPGNRILCYTGWPLG
jgi:hypothetical protein